MDKVDHYLRYMFSGEEKTKDISNKFKSQYVQNIVPGTLPV